MHTGWVGVGYFRGASLELAARSDPSLGCYHGPAWKHGVVWLVNFSLPIERSRTGNIVSLYFCLSWLADRVGNRVTRSVLERRRAPPNFRAPEGPTSTALRAFDALRSPSAQILLALEVAQTLPTDRAAKEVRM